ncbi:UDP-N-acetylmuramoyl-L-alanyl-D-glutamate--2,6-diaminopimelate ligase [Pseudofrancisella aestuarii]|uniref:UDP-N-acetylmuramyl-tripeptide synthetase n=1 Tax=Pseudofrancisella aestuarii TaxID=2670347 RepID=A0ABV9TA43_9GAMM|nr:UDP-N-acetylmuramoyl-L-alanyl-D-glutamate--2,6-diaminopimelate ligase [Pseudofrancisella aestuarii]
MKTIGQISKFLNLSCPQNIENINIQSIVLDSRKCCQQSVFVALKGSLSDGNKYIQEVLSRGIPFVLTDNHALDNSTNVRYVSNLKDNLCDLSQWFYDYKKPKNIIGVTGTNGKTSITNYISQILDLASSKTLLLGTIGNGLYPDLEESTHTTLDTLSLYQKIGMYKNFDNLVMEVSSHSLDQNRVKGLDFDMAVFCNLSHDHLDYHKTMDNYFLAKAKLFQGKNLKRAVINIDDDYGRKLCDITTAKEIFRVSFLDKSADIYLEQLNIESLQTNFKLFLKGQFLGQFSTNLIGEFNLMNIALSLGVVENIIGIKKALENISLIKPVKGRMERIPLANGAVIVIDYAHTPDALEKALLALIPYRSTKLWCLFGCGGNRDTTKRPEMAEIAERYADKVIVTEDNSRLESFDSILADIKKGFTNADKHIYINSREQAIKYSIENAQAGDIILLAGKGHECYMDVNGVKEHFDEREKIAKYGVIV